MTEVHTEVSVQAGTVFTTTVYRTSCMQDYGPVLRNPAPDPAGMEGKHLWLGVAVNACFPITQGVEGWRTGSKASLC